MCVAMFLVSTQLGVYVSSSMMVSDYCVDPEQSIHLLMQGYYKRETYVNEVGIDVKQYVSHFLTCKGQNPLEEQFVHAGKGLHKAKAMLEELSQHSHLVPSTQVMLSSNLISLTHKHTSSLPSLPLPVGNFVKYLANLPSLE